MTEHKICTMCSKIIQKPPDSIGTGYGQDSDGNILCYNCCAELDKRYMEEHDKITLYLECTTRESGYKKPTGVTNWPRSMHFPAVGYYRSRAHNWGISRTDVWFHDHTGAPWHGILYGDNTQLVHCKRLKHDWRWKDQHNVKDTTFYTPWEHIWGQSRP